jgi:glycosyltransferase involved in cell wall biosynthesis
MALDENIVVGIKMLTYNHGRFIAQAIEGVLAQKVNFKIKLYIGDDCSTDNTYEIVETYKNKYPEIIECYSNEENLGVSKNSAKLQSMLRGEYIAFCEGDDYWIDPLKLEKQHAFLKDNLDYNVSVGKYKRWDETKSEFVDFVEKNIDLQRTNRYTTKDYLSYKFSQTSTFFMRNEFVLPPWFNDTTMGDQALFIVALRGMFAHYHDDVFSIYRIHFNGVSSRIGVIKRFKKSIHFFRMVNIHTNGKYLNTLIWRFISGLPMFMKLYMKSLIKKTA